MRHHHELSLNATPTKQAAGSFSLATLALASLALFVLCSSYARAGEGKYVERGVYVALAGTNAFPLFSADVPASTDLVDNLGSSLAAESLSRGLASLSAAPSYENALGLNFAAGLRVLRYVGLDLGLEYIPSFDARSFAPADITTTLITINGRFYLPGLGLGLSDRIQPFALTGAGVLIADTEITRFQSGFAARLGGGLDIWLNDSLALGLTATYVLTTSDVDGLDYVSLGWGFQYTFH
jgi:hypothetical protein